MRGVVDGPNVRHLEGAQGFGLYRLRGLYWQRVEVGKPGAARCKAEREQSDFRRERRISGVSFSRRPASADGAQVQFKRKLLRVTAELILARSLDCEYLE
jgi:hypothetical protein